MADRIGPTFSLELSAAGCLPNGLNWNPVTGDLIAFASEAQRALFLQVLAAHDPTKTPSTPRSAKVSGLLDALSPSQRAAITIDHMNRLVARAALGPVLLVDPKVVRAAADVGITPDAWFDLAGF